MCDDTAIQVDVSACRVLGANCRLAAVSQCSCVRLLDHDAAASEKSSWKKYCYHIKRSL